MAFVKRGEKRIPVPRGLAVVREVAEVGEKSGVFLACEGLLRSFAKGSYVSPHCESSIKSAVNVLSSAAGVVNVRVVASSPMAMVP